MYCNRSYRFLCSRKLKEKFRMRCVWLLCWNVHVAVHTGPQGRHVGVTYRHPRPMRQFKTSVHCPCTV